MAASRLSDLDPDEFRRFLENVTVEEFASSLESLGLEEEAEEDEDEEEEEDDDAA